MRKYKILTADNKEDTIKGLPWTLVLENREEIDVFIHRPYHSKCKYWCVSDVETGMMICGYYEHWCPGVGNYNCGVDTKENALKTALNKLNQYTSELCMSFKKIKEIRTKELEAKNE